MKPTTTISFLLLLCLVSVHSQGFFGGLANFIRGFGGGSRGGARRPAQQAVRGGGGGGGGGACRNSEPNHSFTASEGAAYCRANGMTAVSLDSADKEREFSSLLVREGRPYFWTGGQLNHRARSASWPSGRTTSQHRWSSGQPNNAEGNENCLAIIVKGTPGFNDVACHHRKPVICQQ